MKRSHNNALWRYINFSKSKFYKNIYVAKKQTVSEFDAEKKVGHFNDHYNNPVFFVKNLF